MAEKRERVSDCMKYERLDLSLMKMYPQYSRTFISREIVNGNVMVNGKVARRPGQKVFDADIVSAVLTKQYVSFAGYKLALAINHFGIDVAGKMCLDAGLSTGGFSDCLLQHGAQKIYGIDVGAAQIDSDLAKNNKLIVMEKTDIRTVFELPDKIQVCSLDFSFISLRLVIPIIEKLLDWHAQMIILVKPQFEVGKEFICSGGIVRCDDAKKNAILAISDLCKSYGFNVSEAILAPKKEENINDEYLLYCTR